MCAHVPAIVNLIQYAIRHPAPLRCVEYQADIVYTIVIGKISRERHMLCWLFSAPCSTNLSNDPFGL